ncbi:ADP-ribose pyrophosphatase [Natranaerovirga hydrolytica]|uniref:ADP-ribose pyrophosphatase n=1 Tax=Natranaerovirga hydrolytica TaxID=680378 RepID=A0A4R1MXN2_9FIRM|nr:NUDIX hydrolase [Natranaerovirga hydrolytica]TCK97966.1 ADP-ribose pyrophosphatase [Natranaerovirga hydrolytica]
MDKSDFKRLSRKQIYQGKVINVVQDTMQLPNEKESLFDLVQHNGAAAIIPVDSEGNILMVEQFRNPVNDITLELPAGTLEKGEDPLECAIRELEEETGYASNDLTFLIKFYTAIGFCDEIIHIYVANHLEPSKQNLDDSEFINVKPYSLERLIKMINQGKLIDSKTITGILAYKQYIETNKN